METHPIPALRTPGVIATELGEPLHRVLYILRTRPYITASALAGRVRLYDRAAVVLIRDAMSAIDARNGASDA